MNKLDRYRIHMNILSVLARQDKDFKELQEKANRSYETMCKDIVDLLEEKFANAEDYDSMCYYKCYLEKLR